MNAGTTTFIGGGTGPAAGSTATTVTPGKWHLHRMLQQIEDIPLNIGLFGKGSAAFPEPLVEQIRAGAIGLKIHEDWGATPSCIGSKLDGGG